MIRFPVFVDLPRPSARRRYAFTLRPHDQRELVDEIARALAELPASRGPIRALEKVEDRRHVPRKGRPRFHRRTAMYDDFIPTISSVIATSSSNISMRGQKGSYRAGRRLRAAVRHDRHPDRHGGRCSPTLGPIPRSSD